MIVWWSSLVLGALCLQGAVSLSGPHLPPGPYCAAKPNNCCYGRKDECSAPILGTLCYCDDFCNRTINEDCCPDYWSHCHGVEEPPALLVECSYRGRPYSQGKKIKENCNECTCQLLNGRAEMVCDSDPCLVEESLLQSVNSDPSLTWRARNYTEFWGRKLDDGLKLKTGTLSPQRTTMNMHPLRPIYDPASLPVSFNALKAWPGLLSPIVDQGWCGASWAISSAAVASDKFAIMSKGRERPRLSAQHLLSCNTRGQQSCTGGYLDRAWQFIRKLGLVDEECYPYTGAEEKCKVARRGDLRSSGCTPPLEPPNRKERYRCSPAYRLGNETDIMYEILNSGPPQATMKVYQDLFSYSSGVYSHSRYSPQLSSYHSVRLVGWGVEDGTKYWLVANSWGPQWGENGYFKIARGVKECDIEAFVLAAWANPVEEIEINVEKVQG